MVVGFVDEDMVLTRKEPGQGALGEVVPMLPQQVRSRSAHNKVDLDLRMPVSPWPALTGDVSNHPPVKATRDPKISQHRKKR